MNQEKLLRVVARLYKGDGITSEQLRERSRARLRLVTNARLAERFGVHKNTIDRITNGESWGHVDLPGEGTQ